MSFKVGDKVKYIKNVLLENEDEDDIALIGYEFVIDFIDDGGFHYSKNEMPFLEEELELVERGEKH